MRLRPRILIVEDDAKTAATVATYLRHAGFAVTLVAAGDTGLACARAERPDLVVLDWMLPGLDGISLCRALRAESGTPVILLTARSTEEDTLLGLDAGADDYLAKPFSPRELVARVKAVLRRAPGGAGEERIESGDLVLDGRTQEVTVRGVPVALTVAELRILRTMLGAPGRVLSREELGRRSFGDDYDALDRTIDAHVKNLRRKIEEDRAQPRRILTVFGIGYRYVPAR